MSRAQALASEYRVELHRRKPPFAPFKQTGYLSAVSESPASNAIVTASYPLASWTRVRIGTSRPHCLSTTCRVASSVIQLRPKTSTDPIAVNATANSATTGQTTADAPAGASIRTTPAAANVRKTPAHRKGRPNRAMPPPPCRSCMRPGARSRNPLILARLLCTPGFRLAVHEAHRGRTAGVVQDEDETIDRLDRFLGRRFQKYL